MGLTLLDRVQPKGVPLLLGRVPQLVVDGPVGIAVGLLLTSEETGLVDCSGDLALEVSGLVSTEVVVRHIVSHLGNHLGSPEVVVLVLAELVVVSLTSMGSSVLLLATGAVHLIIW